MDLSFRDYVNQTKETRAPVYSELFTGADGKNRITLTYPILRTFELNEGNNSGLGNEATNTSNDYLGLVAVSIPYLKCLRDTETYSMLTPNILSDTIKMGPL